MKPYCAGAELVGWTGESSMAADRENQKGRRGDEFLSTDDFWFLFPEIQVIRI